MSRQLAIDTLDIDEILNQLRSDSKVTEEEIKIPGIIRLLRKSRYEMLYPISPYFLRTPFQKLEFSVIVGPHSMRPNEDFDCGLRIKTECVDWYIPDSIIDSPDTEFTHLGLVRLFTFKNPKVKKKINEERDYKLESDVIYNALHAIQEDIRKLDPDFVERHRGIVAKIENSTVGLNILQQPLFPHIDYTLVGPEKEVSDISDELNIREIEGMFTESARSLVLNSYVRKGIAYNLDLKRDRYPSFYDQENFLVGHNNIIF